MLETCLPTEDSSSNLSQDRLFLRYTLVAMDDVTEFFVTRFIAH